MKKMLMVLVLAGLPLSAQSWEVGLFLGQQSYSSFNAAGMDTKPDNKPVGILRGGYSFVDFGPALLQVNAAIQPKSSSNVTINGTGIGLNLDHQATSLGFAFIFKAGVSASLGLDYRWDKLEANFMGASASTTYARPWVRGNIGFAFPTPLIKPFVGLELAAPLSKKDIGSLGPATDEEALKGLAPKLQIGIYGGIRF